MDQVATFADGKHWHNLHEYYKVLRQRNVLLKNFSYNGGKGLEEWDVGLLKYGELVRRKRSAVCREINRLAQKVHLKGSNGENLEIYYHESGFNFRELREKEIEKGLTLQGPHLDKVVINIDSREARISASYGQKRNAALSLKIAEIELIKELKGQYPILLLDDIFLGLDESRQTEVIGYLSKSPQVIFAFSDASYLDQLPYAPSQVSKVDGGKVFRNDHTN